MVALALATLALALAPQGQIREDSYRSQALGGRLPFAVYLPPGYDPSSGRRHPVIYFLHGLPASVHIPRDRLHRLLDALHRRRRRRPRRRDGDSDPEYLDWGPGRNWETAIATELPRYVDAHYRTIRSRLGRAVVGISAGGYGR